MQKELSIGLSWEILESVKISIQVYVKMKRAGQNSSQLFVKAPRYSERSFVAKNDDYRLLYW
ncbi:MAG: hypothetical protein IT289_06235 [Oligoflexia bacterium]|nr:hypothetical protein [Oligoflexia bacterium]